ncbi:uncharacterized protein LOC117194117 isoform X4 [Drosophila miranda]|uniref:uncharacterized protein LOC117194117 isoform X4 n=1 Tax=Drosophila miranda TaxID=7229 RepID=UPI00143FAD68|nr:uncharacterized protein LOC117194117 isoform X4 [Drosophila miranda]
MLRIHVKMGPQRSHHPSNNNNSNGTATSSNGNRQQKEFTCCFGLHVHTATLMIGLWHLLGCQLIVMISHRIPKHLRDVQKMFLMNLYLSPTI